MMSLPHFPTSYLLLVEVSIQFLFRTVILIGEVFHYLAMFEQCDARTDVDGVSQVVATDDDCGTCCLIVIYQGMLQHILARWVEKIERLVEDYKFRTMEQGGYYADFLFVACREVSDEFLLV